MHAIALSASDQAPLATFPLMWRWTQESHAVFSAYELGALAPLTSEAALRASHTAGLLHGPTGLNPELLEGIIEHAVSSEESARAWLAGLPVPQSAKVLISWNRVMALALPWSLFVQRWGDFCYPSSDDATILPLSGGWALAYFHYEVLLWGRARAV